MARAGFVGMDNRRADQIAAFIAGRTLERVEGAEVAVVVGYYSYRGHEDREIGFRTTLREYFPYVQSVEVITRLGGPFARTKGADELAFHLVGKPVDNKP